MDGSWLGPVVMIAGGCLFALTSIFAIRSVARLALTAPTLHRELAELKGQVAGLQVQVAQAMEDAESARRIASRRKRKADRRPTEDPEPVPPSVPASLRWVPGMASDGRAYDDRPSQEQTPSGGAQPMELVD